MQNINDLHQNIKEIQCISFIIKPHNKNLKISTLTFDPRESKKLPFHLHISGKHGVKYDYYSKIFARNLFSRIWLNDIFATLNIRDYGMINLHH